MIQGYRIPLFGAPRVPGGLPEFYGSEGQELIDDHVQELLHKRAIYKISDKMAQSGFTSPLLLVKKKNGKQRLFDIK